MNTPEAELIGIRKVREDFLAAYNARDLRRLCALLIEDAVLMPPNEPSVTGIEEIRGRLESFFGGFTFSIRFSPAQTDLIGNLAFDRGSYTAYALLKGEAGQPRGGYGEYLLLFEREPDGTWKVASFGTAAAQSVPQHDSARDPLRFDRDNHFESTATYWHEKWADILDKRYPTHVAADVLKAHHDSDKRYPKTGTS